MVNLSKTDARKELSVFEIRLEGEFDLSERARLMDAFAIASSAPLVVLNLTRTSYMDSSVLECMIALRLATARRGARLVLTGISGCVRRLFDISRLDGYFDVQPGYADTLGRGFEGLRRLTLVSAIETNPSPP